MREESGDHSTGVRISMRDVGKAGGRLRRVSPIMITTSMEVLNLAEVVGKKSQRRFIIGYRQGNKWGSWLCICEQMQGGHDIYQTSRLLKKIWLTVYTICEGPNEDLVQGLIPTHKGMYLWVFSQSQVLSLSISPT
jgi:hypothetical protein